MPILIQPTLNIKILTRKAEVVFQVVDDGGDLAEGFEFAVPDYGLLVVHQKLGGAQVVGDIVEGLGLGVRSHCGGTAGEQAKEGVQGGEADPVFGWCPVYCAWIWVICQAFGQFTEVEIHRDLHMGLGVEEIGPVFITLVINRLFIGSGWQLKGRIAAIIGLGGEAKELALRVTQFNSGSLGVTSHAGEMDI